MTSLGANRIRLLPEQVANQIAAGEVVERPASVVKELVENSLDAEATRIEVAIKAGGKGLIRVSDNGQGMSRDDALLCLERHATSKIAVAADLARIHTMGFRGEALPSIASVSRFTLTTRPRESEDPVATQIVIAGGKIQTVREAGRDAGATVEVRQLFFNLPARRKFLRAQETEKSHIQHYLMLVALARPDVALVFSNEERLVWQLPARTPRPARAGGSAEGLRERWRAVHGGSDSLLAVDFHTQIKRSPFSRFEERAAADAHEEPASEETTQTELRVWGLIGAPGVARANREYQHLFVNGRPVDNRGLNFALLEGYHNALMKGRYPVCCLFLEIDPAEVDVNIHPAKREVKFREEWSVRRAVTQAVRGVLLDYHTRFDPNSGNSPTDDSRSQQTENIPVAQPPTSEARQSALEFTHAPPPSLPPARFSPSNDPLGAVPAPASPEAGVASNDQASPMPADDPPPEAFIGAAPSSEAPVTRAGPAPTAPLLSIPLKLIGVVGHLYVVLESDRGLVLLDQHAAHERILYEQMLARLEQKDAPSQRLLLPETIDLPPRDAQFLREQLSELTRLGVSLSEFGERTFLLDALPPFVPTARARVFVLEMIHELKTVGQTMNTMRLGEAMVAKTVCRHAVKANDQLSALELEQLVRDLRQCAMPYTCPHGRPTLIELSFPELEKKFGRVA